MPTGVLRFHTLVFDALWEDAVYYSALPVAERIGETPTVLLYFPSEMRDCRATARARVHLNTVRPIRHMPDFSSLLRDRNIEPRPLAPESFTRCLGGEGSRAK
jgi:hypothetical protein